MHRRALRHFGLPSARQRLLTQSTMIYLESILLRIYCSSRPRHGTLSTSICSSAHASSNCTGPPSRRLSIPLCNQQVFRCHLRLRPPSLWTALSDTSWIVKSSELTVCSSAPLARHYPISCVYCAANHRTIQDPTKLSKFLPIGLAGRYTPIVTSGRTLCCMGSPRVGVNPSPSSKQHLPTTPQPLAPST